MRGGGGGGKVQGEPGGECCLVMVFEGGAGVEARWEVEVWGGRVRRADDGVCG